MEEDKITAEDVIKALEKLKENNTPQEIDTDLITKCVLSKLPEGKNYVFGREG